MKLGMGDIIYSAFVALRRGGKPLSLCLGLWAAIDFTQRIYGPVSHWFTALPISGPANGLFPWPRDSVGLLPSADVGMRTIIICVFIALSFRLLLIGKIGPWGFGRAGLLRASAANLLALMAVVGVVRVLNFLYQGVAYTWMSIWIFRLFQIGAPILIVTVIAYLFARLCLVWPSAAVGQGLAPIRNWRRTAGNGFRLALINATVVFGLFFVDGILDAYIVELLSGYLAISLPVWTLAAMTTGQMILLMMFLIALAAVAFARLTEFPSAGIPGAGKTSEQLADTFE